MNDASVVGVAVVASAIARLALDVPLWLIAAGVAIALLARRPPLLCVPLVLVIGWHSHRDLVALDDSPRHQFTGWVTLTDDASRGNFGASAEVRLGDGRRVLAQADDVLAGDLAPTTMGSRLLLEGRLGPLSRRTDRTVARHLAGSLAVESIIGRARGGWPFELADRVRSTLTRGASGIGAEGSALFEGLVLGDDRHQDDLTRHRFRASGLSHLLVVSGENVAFVLVAAAPLTSRLSLRWRLGVTLVVLVGFGTLVRWEPSVLRAIAMSGIASLAAFRGRRVSGLRVLALAVLALVTVDPLIVWSLGFWLSVTATLGLVLLARRTSRVLPGPRFLADALGVVLAAQIGAVPLVVTVFGVVPASALIANLVAVPAAGWVMVWGCTAGFAAGVGPSWLAMLIHFPTRLLEWWIATTARLAATPGLPVWGPFGAALTAVAIVAGVWSWRRPRVIVRRIGVVVACGAGVAAILLGLRGPPSGVQPAGRGAQLAVGLHGEQVLIIGGAAHVDDVLDSLDALHVGSVDLVVVTARGAARPAGTVIEELGATRVVAADRSGLPAASQLTAGVIRVGALLLDVDERDDRWTVTARIESEAPV